MGKQEEGRGHYALWRQSTQTFFSSDRMPSSIDLVALPPHCLRSAACAPSGGLCHPARPAPSPQGVSVAALALQSSFQHSPFPLLSAEELPLTICYRISQSLSTCPQDFSPNAAQLVLLFIVCLVFSFLEEVLFFCILFS